MRPFWRGVAAGAVSQGFSAAARWAGAAPFLPELMALRLFELIPMRTFEFFVRLLGEWAKWAAFGGTLLLALAGAGVAGCFAAALPQRWTPARRAGACALALSAFAAFVLLPLLGSGPLGRGIFPRPLLPAPVGLLLPASVYAAAFEAASSAALREVLSERRFTRRRL